MSDELLGTMMDALNEVLERAEAVLKRHCVSGYLCGEEVPNLGFKKVGDRWRLVWLEDGCEPFLVLGSSREMRVRAARLVPALDRALAAEASEQGHQIRQAVVELERWVESHEAETK